jgi:hypothetical protein
VSDLNTQQKSGSEAASGSTTYRSSSSLVMRLNLHKILYTFGVLITVNILLCLAVLSFTLWKAEDNAASLLSELSPKNETVMDYTFEPSPKNPKGFDLWSVLHRETPLRDYKVLRRVWFDAQYGYPLSALKYQIISEDEKVTVTYRLGTVL